MRNNPPSKHLRKRRKIAKKMVRKANRSIRLMATRPMVGNRLMVTRRALCRGQNARIAAHLWSMAHRIALLAKSKFRG